MTRLDSRKGKRPDSFDCDRCDREIPRGDPLCQQCRAEAEAERPMKLGLMVFAPDDTITGAIVRRDGEDWHYEEKS